MGRGHPSIPFLTAAITALLLYRGMTSLAGLDVRAIFHLSVATAVLCTIAFFAASLVWPLRKE